MDLKSTIRTVPDFPIKGVMFRDITTLLKHPEAFKQTCDQFYERYKDMKIDKIAGIESRGFIFGSVLAYKLGLGFVLIRKPGKLPAETVKEEYELEYGKDAVEVHKDAILEGDKVLLVDDLIATAGTAGASAKLIRKIGGDLIECSFVIELPDLGGRNKLEKQGLKVHSMIQFEGD